MNKKSIVIIVVAIISLAVITLISYIITKKNNHVVAEVNNLQNDTQAISNKDASISDVDEYKNIDKDSNLAREIYDFVPKYFQNFTNKMSNDYIIYSAISKLEEKNPSNDNYTFGNGQFAGYKANLVEEKAKEIFGSNIKLDKKDKYDLPIAYNNKEDVFCKYPMSYDTSEEFQVIKEVKENSKTYKLTVYALNIEYDTDDFNNIYVSTKDTFKLYKNGNLDENSIKASMKKYFLNGIDIDPDVVVNEFKNDLPVIEYELEKLDDRGTKYFVKNIKLIID